MGLMEQIGGGIIGEAMGGISRKNQERQNARLMQQQSEMQKDLTRFNNEQALMMWKDTGPVGLRKQIEEAGLSTGLMYGGGGAGGGTVSNSAGSVSSGTAQESSNMMQGMLTQAQIENIQADTEKKKAETVNTGADTEGKNLSNKWEAFVQNPDGNEGTDGTPLKETDFRVNINQRRSMIEKIDKEMKKMGIDMDKGNAEIKRIEQDTEMMKQLEEFRKAMNPMELEKFQKELEVYKQNPENNEIVQWIETILGFGGKLTGMAK